MQLGWAEAPIPPEIWCQNPSNAQGAAFPLFAFMLPRFKTFSLMESPRSTEGRNRQALWVLQPKVKLQEDQQIHTYMARHQSSLVGWQDNSWCWDHGVTRMNHLLWDFLQSHQPCTSSQTVPQHVMLEEDSTTDTGQVSQTQLLASGDLSFHRSNTGIAAVGISGAPESQGSDRGHQPPPQQALQSWCWPGTVWRPTLPLWQHMKEAQREAMLCANWICGEFSKTATNFY